MIQKEHPKLTMQYQKSQLQTKLLSPHNTTAQLAKKQPQKQLLAYSQNTSKVSIKELTQAVVPLHPKPKESQRTQKNQL
jgi:hypothetical protein